MKPEDIRKAMREFSPAAEIIDTPKKKKTLPPKKTKHVDYFEGELHLRNISPDILKYVYRRVSNEGEHIPNVEEHSDKDFDLLLSSNSLLRKLGKELQQKFGGEVTMSEKLFTRDHQTSKNLYRLNLSYRHHTLATGDVLALDSQPWIVKSFKGKRIILENPLTKKRKNITSEDKPLEKFKTSVIQIEPSVHVLDQNYQSVPATAGDVLVIGQKVTTVKIAGQFFVV
jgi:NMD protein affecting ribosome stability and mRNA decay